MNSYKDNMEHVIEELTKVDLFVGLEKIRIGDTKDGSNYYQGMYITGDDVDYYLKHKDLKHEWFSRQIFTGEEYDNIKQTLLLLQNQVNEKIENTLNQGITLNLVDIKNIFYLSDIEYNIILIALAHQLDSKYYKIFSYLQDDVTKRSPTVELLLNFSCMTLEQKILSRDIFSPQSNLFKYRILEYVAGNGNSERPLLHREVKLNNRIAGFILGNSLIDDDISKICRLNLSKVSLDDISIPFEKKNQLKNLILYLASENNNRQSRNIISFYGNFGDQKKDVAQAVCSELNVPLLETDIATLMKSELTFEENVNLILRECRLIPCAILFKNVSRLLDSREEKAGDMHYFFSAIDTMSWLAFFDTDEAPKLHGNFMYNKYFEIGLSLPEYNERLELWNRNIDGYKVADGIDLKKIASKFLLNSSQLRDAVNTAMNIAIWKDPFNPIIEEAHILEACHLHSSKKLKDLAVYIKPRYKWDDIVLPENIVYELKQIVTMVNHRHIVYNEWGFENKLALGKGICALFFGTPGTGKTMAADVIANELGMELYKVDVSTVISKYIGETEKNLNTIFETARYSNAVLFFDEADSLFGKRTEVKDSHDRYANIEVSYLLQKIDEFTGVVILATNFYNNIDSAFERRIHFILNFPQPDEKYRLSIWSKIFPPEAPLSDNVKFEDLAAKLKINGGTIKNIALSSAFFAAEEKSVITMEHINRAAKKEYDKLGFLWDKDLNFN